jgi:hypothetical protein
MIHRAPSAPIPKFASVLRHARLRTSESKGTSNVMILVPLEPEVRNWTRGNYDANFGFAALVERARVPNDGRQPQWSGEMIAPQGANPGGLA